MFSDLRHALRSLRRSPGFVAAAVLILALGIGVNTAIFSVLRAVLLEPFPFRAPGRLAWVWATRVDRDRAFFSIPNFQDTRAAARSFEDLAGFTPWGPTLSGDFEPERLSAVRVTGNAFRVLGTPVGLGRPIELSDETSRVALITHGLWVRRFGGDAAVVGSPVTLNGETYAIVGVLPRGFLFPGADDAELAVPMSLAADPRRAERGSNFLRVFGRLAPGADAGRSAAELASITARLRDGFPDENAKLTAPRVLPLTEEIVGGSRRVLVVLSVAVGILLLVACANIAALGLVRSLGRRHELSVRAALGAGLARLVAPSLWEALLVSAGGALVSVVIARRAVPWLLALAPSSLPRAGAASVDGAALGATLAAATLCAVLCGLAPSLVAARRSALGRLGAPAAARVAPRGRGRLFFVFAQVALSLTLLAGAMLLVKSFRRVSAVDAGFMPERVLSVRLTLGKARYPDAEAAARFFDAAAGRLRRLPGVESAGAVSVLPLSGMNARQDFEVAGRPAAKRSEAPGAQTRWVGPGYFETLGIRVRRGRSFTERDDRRAPGVAIVDEALARELFPSGGAVGARLRLEDAVGAKREAEIVAVVGSVKHFTLEERPMGTLYLPIAQIPENMLSNLLGSANLVARAGGDPADVVPSVRRAIREIDPDVPTGGVKTMGEVRGAALAARRFVAVLIALFAAAAAALAGVGLYGSLSELVASERRSIGVRVALGASASDIVRHVGGRGLRLTAAGIAAGFALALPLCRLLAASLYEVSPADPVALLSAALLLLAVAAVAGVSPALRASRLDPIAALKAE